MKARVYQYGDISPEIELPDSILIKSQNRTFEKLNVIDHNISDHPVDIIVNVRYDDQCNNKHNTFAITGDVYKAGSRSSSADIMGGCIHDEIESNFPELKQYVKWHGCTSEGPLYYIANTIYHISNDNLNAAQQTAIWHDATKEQLSDPQTLLARLPQLMEQFKHDMEQLGFVY